MKLNRTLIVSVFVVASCGLAYELIMAALASYLLGDSILQFSSIIGLYLFAMGIGRSGRGNSRPCGQMG